MQYYSNCNISYESCQELMFRLTDDLLSDHVGVQSVSTKSVWICLPFIFVEVIALYFNFNMSELFLNVINFLFPFFEQLFTA